ncbi:MAG: hypothetical protein Q9162_006147 [Coniocarpon cinnabarinum]
MHVDETMSSDDLSMSSRRTTWQFVQTISSPSSFDVESNDAQSARVANSTANDAELEERASEASSKTQIEREGSLTQRVSSFRLPKGKTYSIPEPELFQEMSRKQIRSRVQGKMENEIPRAAWFAGRTAPPLLLTFDAFDTLYTPKEPVPKQYVEIAARLGYQVTEEQIQPEFKKAFKAVSEQYPRQGRDVIKYREWWAKVIEKTFETFKNFRRPWPDPDLVDRLFEHFSSRQGYTLFPDVSELFSLIGTAWQAKEWAPKRTMLGVVSNSDPRVRPILRSFGLQVDNPGLFPPRYAPEHRNDIPNFGPAGLSFTTISYECGYDKPDERIYDQAVQDAQKALDSLDASRRLTRSGLELLTNIRNEFQFLHVGDNLEKDVLPAFRRGWDAVLLDRTAEEAVSERVVDSSGLKVTVVNSLLHIAQVATKERMLAGLETRLGHSIRPVEHEPDATDPLQDLSALRRQRRERKAPRKGDLKPVPASTSHDTAEATAQTLGAHEKSRERGCRAIRSTPARREAGSEDHANAQIRDADTPEDPRNQF